MIDAVDLGMAWRETAKAARRKSATDADSFVHTIMPDEVLDPSLTCERVYGNRADWIVAAAVASWCDCDTPIETGARRLLSLREAVEISQKAAGINARDKGLTLW